MNCYHCTRIDYKPWLMNYQLSPAVGVCRQCGEAVCAHHAVKSDIPLPSSQYALTERTHPALLPLLCADCYDEIRALSAAGQV
ncbi:MAG: DUF2180 family protein [Chloroflexi bacterium]|nr:DUF2180 family protein [Chloroflexota bacterium]